MTKPLIYLAGPITGVSYDTTVAWRDDVSLAFGDSFTCYSPMRHKEYLAGEVSIADAYSDKIMSGQRGIFGRDMFDVQRTDALFINFLDARRVSIGTVMEMTLAWYMRHPVVVVMETENIHRHSMLMESTPWVVETLDEGVEIMRRLFL